MFVNLIFSYFLRGSMRQHTTLVVRSQVHLKRSAFKAYRVEMISAVKYSIMLVLSCTQHGDLRQRFQSLCAQPHRPIRWMHTVLFRKERLALNEDVSSLWRQSLAKRGLRCRV